MRCSLPISISIPNRILKILFLNADMSASSIIFTISRRPRGSTDFFIILFLKNFLCFFFIFIFCYLCWTKHSLYLLFWISTYREMGEWKQIAEFVYVFVFLVCCSVNIDAADTDFHWKHFFRSFYVKLN